MAGEEMSFTVKLTCTETDSSEVVELKFRSFPRNVLDVKKHIEKECSIPVCCQSLSYQGTSLGDEAEFNQSHFRSNDVLEVSYVSKADCRELASITGWIRQVAQLYREAPTGGDLEKLIEHGKQANLNDRLGTDLFDWLKKRTYMNKLYFHDIGGLDSLMELYSLLLEKNWQSLNHSQKYLENFCLFCLSNFAEDFPLRRKIVEREGLELCMRSFVQVKVEGESDDDNSEEAADLHAMLWNSLHLICNLSELPECQLTICSNSSVLQQLVSLSNFYKSGQYYGCAVSIVVAEAFLCLAHSVQSHHLLSKPELLEGLLTAYEKSLPENASSKMQLSVLALRCCTLVAIAQLVVTAPKHIPDSWCQKIEDKLTSFLQTYTPEELHEYEVEHNCIYDTLMPYVRSLYTPIGGTGDGSTSVSQQLHSKCLNVILFFLQSTLMRKLHCDVLARERLVEFVTMLPWHVPMQSQEVSLKVVHELHVHVSLQPPSLVNLSKAQLAYAHGLGLDKLMKTMSIGEIANSVYKST